MDRCILKYSFVKKIKAFKHISLYIKECNLSVWGENVKWNISHDDYAHMEAYLS